LKTPLTVVTTLRYLVSLATFRINQVAKLVLLKNITENGLEMISLVVINPRKHTKTTPYLSIRKLRNDHMH